MDLVLFSNGKSRLQQVAEAVLQAVIDISGVHAFLLKPSWYAGRESGKWISSSSKTLTERRQNIL